MFHQGYVLAEALAAAAASAASSSFRSCSSKALRSFSRWALFNRIRVTSSKLGVVKAGFSLEVDEDGPLFAAAAGENEEKEGGARPAFFKGVPRSLRLEKSNDGLPFVLGVDGFESAVGCGDGAGEGES